MEAIKILLALEEKLDRVLSSVEHRFPAPRTRKLRASPRDSTDQSDWQSRLQSDLLTISKDLKKLKKTLNGLPEDTIAPTPDVQTSSASDHLDAGACPPNNNPTSPQDSEGQEMSSLNPQNVHAGFSLTPEQMGLDLIPNLAKFITDERFTGEVKVQDLGIDWGNFMKTIQRPKAHEYAAIQYRRHAENGVTRLLLSHSSNVRIPSFSNPIEKPSDADIIECLQKFFNEPPTKDIPYYWGPSLADKSSAEHRKIDNLLHPGEELSQIDTRMSGINSLYWYLGAKHSGTSIHSEDESLRSCNILAIGWKVWLRIATQHTSKFEDLAERLFPDLPRVCNDQFVRHKAFIISPERLKQEGIEYTITCVGPGSMMVTRPREYHWVFNVTDCFAIAINFLLPGEKFLSKDILLCRQCGLWELRTVYPQIKIAAPAIKKNTPALTTRPKASPGLKRPLADLASRTPPKKRNEVSSPARRSRQSKKPGDSESAAVWQNYLVRADVTCEPFQANKIYGVNPIVLRIALATRSRFAAENLFDIVRGWRSQGSMERDLLVGIKFSENSERSDESHPGKLATLISTLETRGALGALLVALGQIRFAQVVEHRVARTRLDNSNWDTVRALLDPSVQTQIENRQLSEWRARGKALGRFSHGLLCLIPQRKKDPYHVSLLDLKMLKDTDVEVLSKLLDYNGRQRHLLGIGTDIIHSMISGMDIPIYKWEVANPDPDNTVHTELLEPVQ